MMIMGGGIVSYLQGLLADKIGIQFSYIIGIACFAPFPILSTNSANKFFDYLAAGLPVLINYPGWLTEMIRENDCGFVVAPNDPSAFADALEFAASDRDNLKAMGQRGRLLAEKEFDRERLADRWVDALENTWHLKAATSRAVT